MIRSLLVALALLFVGCLEVEERHVCYPPSISRELIELISGCLEGRGDAGLFRADSDGHDGRHWDSARKWCTSAGLLYVATDGVLRVYGPGAWWGVAE